MERARLHRSPSTEALAFGSVSCAFCGERNGPARAPLAPTGLDLCPECRELIKGLHAHLDIVVLPDGSPLTAASLFAGYERRTVPDFALYLDPLWQPPWPHAHLDWPDYGAPADPGATIRALDDLLSRARAGQHVEVGCLGGHGRTGTALGCMAVLAGLAPGEAVEWVRAIYCPLAIETDGQAAFVEGVA